MKHTYIIIILLIFALTGSSFAQAVNDADSCLFVFGVNNAVDGFPLSEIDSISYNIDDSGNITQIIHHIKGTQEYKLDDIENIKPLTTEIQINPDVFILTAAHIPYIEKADTISFIMKTDTPDMLRPKKGNIVVSDFDCISFEDGIMAKITGINKTSKGYEYTCERASYFDVFDKLIYAGDAENTNAVATRAPGDPLDGNTLWNFNINFQQGALEVNTRNQGIARFAFYRNQNDYRATLNLQTRNEETAELNYLSPSISHSFEIIRPISLGTFRIPHPLLSFIFIRPTFELSINLDSKTGVKTTLENRRVDEYQLVWDNSGVSMIHTTPINTRTVNTTLDATEYEVSLYFQPRILLGFNGTRNGVGISADFGLKLFNDEMPDNFQTMNAEEAYLELEDKGVHLNDMSSGNWFAQTNLFSLNPDNDHRVTRNFAYREIPVATYYYLPRFNNAGLEYNEGNIDVRYNVFRDTWSPVNVGIGIFDKDGNMYDHYLEETSYQHENMNMRCNWIFGQNHLKPGSKFHPIVAFGGRILSGHPSLEVRDCPARIKSMKATNAFRYKADNTERMVVEIELERDSSSDVVEWGFTDLYTYLNMDQSKTEIKESIMIYNTTENFIEQGKIDFRNKVFKISVEEYAYAVIRNKETNRLDTLYSNVYEKELIYDKTPSIKYTAAVIWDTEVVNTTYDEDSNREIREYMTRYMRSTEYQGMIWMDYVETICTNGWTSYPDPSYRFWYPDDRSDFYVSLDESFNHYYTDTILEYSQWKKIVCRETGDVFNSNCLNFWGDGETIIGVSITEEPVYNGLSTRSGDNSGGGQRVMDINKVIENQYSNLRSMKVYPE